MNLRQVPFPFYPMFRNGPRRQGGAQENLFHPGKDFPAPRPNRAPLPTAGRSEDFPMRRGRGQMQRQNHLHLRLCAASRWSPPSCTKSLE